MNELERSRREMLGQVGRLSRQTSFPLGKLAVVPRIQVPGLNPRLLETIKKFNEAFEPIIEAQRQIARRYSIFGESGFAKFWQRLDRETKQCERLEALGWLPHISSPFDLIGDGEQDAEVTDGLVAEHYVDNWPSIAQQLIERMSEAGIDEEAKATFTEVITVHGAGHYRIAARVLFPEVERLSRLIVHDGAMDKIASQPLLRDRIGNLTPSEMSSSGVIGLRLYEKLETHLYEHVNRPELVEKTKLDPVPNRHAAIHGYVAYNTRKSSVNAIIIADYLFHAISTIKRLSIEEAEAGNEP